MKPRRCFGGLRGQDCYNRAFTRFELLAIILALFAIASVCIPLLANNSFQSNQIACLNNLRQIGIAFQAWGNDHDDRRPWFVFTNEGGSRLHPLRDNAFIHFSFLSNHLSSPAVLIDPGETSRNKRLATRWDFSSQGGFLNPGFQNNALSYMLGVHTTLGEANEILLADRHVHFDGFGGCSYGFAQVGNLGSGPYFRGWTNGPHGVAGNLLLNDGRVEFASQTRLGAVLLVPDDLPGNEHFLTPF
jgi:hypothetical protein